MLNKRFGSGFSITFFFLFFNICASDDSQYLFSKAEGLFSDSLYFSAIESYRAGINGIRASFESNIPNVPAAFYKIGLCYYRTGNFSAAAESFEEYLRLFPADTHFTEALYYCAESYKASGDLKDASEQYYRAWLRNSALPGRKLQAHLFDAARCAELDGNDERAASIYDEYLNKYPGDEKTGEIVFYLTGIYIKQKKFSTASDILTKAEKKISGNDSSFLRLLYAKALIAKAQMKNENAYRFFSAIMGSDYDSPVKEQALEDFAAMLYQDSQYKTLLPVYKKLSDMRHKIGASISGEFIFTWASCAKNAGDFDLAEKLFRQIIEEYPGSVQKNSALYNIAECQLSGNQQAKALSTLQEITSGDYPFELRARAALAAGDIYLSMGLYPNAVSAYRNYCVMPGIPDGDSIQFRIAEIYQEKSLFAVALKEYERCMQTYPLSRFYYVAAYNAGLCDEALSRFMDAMNQYDYIRESSAPAGITEKACKRAEYIRQFGAPGAEAAVSALGRMFKKGVEGIPAFERFMAIADIFADILHDLPAASDLYEQVERCVPAPPDSVLASALFRNAAVTEKMYVKALADHDAAAALKFKNKALALYRNAARSIKFPSMADDAEFHIMTLCSPSIADYEQYASHHSGKHANEALLYIGEYYERKTIDSDPGTARKAIDAYNGIIRSGEAECLSGALLGLVRTYYVVNRTDSASVYAESFLRSSQDSSTACECLFFTALIEKKRNNYKASIEIFEKIIESYPFGDFARKARYEIAAVRFDAGDFNEALRDFRTYERNYSGGENIQDAKLGISMCLEKTGKTDESCKMLNVLLNEKNLSAFTGRVYAGLAQCARSKGDIHSALNYLNKAFAIDSFPGRGAVCLGMGAIYFEKGLYPEAAGAFYRGLGLARLAADSMEALQGNIESLVMDGRKKAADKAAAFFKKRFGANKPAYTHIEYYYALRELIEKKYYDAIKKFGYIINDESADSGIIDDAAYQTGVCYFYMDKQEKALEVFHDFIAQYPGSVLVPMAYFKIGMMLHDRGEFQQAAEAFEKVLSIRGADAKTRFRAAYNAAIDRQKSFAWLDAARMYRTISDIFPEYASASSTNLKTGFCYIQASHFEDALKYFSKALVNASPEEKPEILYWTAHCLGKLGKRQKAIEEYLKVPELCPSAGQWPRTSELEAARLYEQDGEFKKAIVIYKRIIAADGEKSVFGKEAVAQYSRIASLIKGN